jgi:transposase
VDHSEPICFSPYLYRARNLVERFFNKIRQCRRVDVAAHLVKIIEVGVGE